MVRMKWIAVWMLCLCAVLANANPKPKGDRPHQFGPDAMFAWIADDLKLSDEQRTQYDRITAELKEVKKNMQVKKLEELKSFIGLVNKGSVTDADIDAYDKVCADNEIASQSEIAAKMSELYSILDPNQQKRFIEKMTPKMPDGKGKDQPKGKNPPKNPPKGKKPPKGKPDMRHGEGHRMPPPNGDRPDMRHGDGHRMPPQDRFADNGHKPNHDGHQHPNGGMHGDHHGRMMPPCEGHSPQTMMLGNLARELKLDKEQSEKYHNIKREMREKMAENFAKCDPNKKDKPCRPFDYLTEGQTVEQMKAKIAERVNNGAEGRKFALKKYFEFYGCLTDAQKEVVKLKYQYDVAKMSLPSQNDRK